MSWQQAAAEIVNALPHRIHEVMDRYVAATPDRTALIDDKARLTYREAPRSDNSVGTLISGIEARIVGRGGAAMANDEIGELHVRGPNVMRGYDRAPDLTAKAIDPNGWFNTGDLARLEGDALFIIGRTKEMIIRSGFNVYPAEIEAVLSTHSDVVQCAVVGRSVEGNEEIVAFVQVQGRHGNRAGPHGACRAAAHLPQAAVRDHPDGRAAPYLDGQAAETQIGGVAAHMKRARSLHP